MFLVFSPIFVADTKITFVYNFVAPLRLNSYLSYADTNINLTRDFNDSYS